MAAERAPQPWRIPTPPPAIQFLAVLPPGTGWREGESRGPWGPLPCPCLWHGHGRGPRKRAPKSISVSAKQTLKYATGATAPVAPSHSAGSITSRRHRGKGVFPWAGGRSCEDRPPAQGKTRNTLRGLSTAERTPTLANLPEVLKQIQDEYGAAPALDLGMQLMGNFATVSSIILSNLKGEAVALAVRMLLRDVPQQDQEWELPKIIAETYSSIGRDSLGARPQKPQFQGKINKDNTKQQPEGNKKRWEKKQQTPKKERGESPRTETPQNRTHRKREMREVGGQSGEQST
ncbi:hypothetical protein NDU88_007195 [Pleurodeles waltl]|uniref:Gag protein n=1 Tax=Pleurodeles waltl TaxID=8319 RepID=A0AAV7PKY1_PLEWA|nr:hypothetical protein NDU88_007195 [Pleurodeles waltl]